MGFIDAIPSLGYSLPEDVQLAVITALIMSIVGPAAVLLIQHWLAKPKIDIELDQASVDISRDLQEIARNAVQQAAEANKRVTALTRKVQELEKAITGPFILTVEFTTYPIPSIIRQTISLKENSKNA